MKHNVDLSENRIFTTFRPPTGQAKLIYDLIKITKPWDFENKPVQITSDSDLANHKTNQPIFAVGNKKQRQVWKLNHSDNADEICDYCRYNRCKRPWAKSSCNFYYTIYSPRIPWKF